MHRKSCEQSNRSLLYVCATSALAMGMVVCAVSTAYPFSVGILPGRNCDILITKYDIPIPCDLAKTRSQYEEVHQLITVDALGQVVFIKSPELKFSSYALMQITDANAGTDRLQGGKGLHFDNDSRGLTEGGQLLIDFKSMMLEELRRQSTASPAQANGWRKSLGRALHTVQDFYSHTNYENLVDKPLIQLGKELPPVNDRDKPCEADHSTLSPDGYLELNSGYAESPLWDASAPPGQCAHGFLDDGIHNPGIHKDWKGRLFHDEARSRAIIATTLFVNSIINVSSNNPSNVCMLMTGKPCQESNPWVGTWSGSTTSSCGAYSGPVTLTITSGGSNLLNFTSVWNGGSASFSGSYSGNTATSELGSTYALNGNTITVAYPPACQTATVTRQ
jgi:hypothetical protein